MAIYSNSKINAFENCPYQYKLHYIDKIKPEISTTIEAFMGDIVHQSLEKLYTDKKFKKKVSKSILLKFYKDLWKKEYSEDILIVKEGLTPENYKKMGEKYISDYYDKYKNDKMTILGLETQDKMILPDGNYWHVRMDKLGCHGDIYYVCDYKTNSSMKTQDDADSDRQLAMYSIWVKDKFKDAKKVILKWHMLAFNKDVTSERTPEQLKKLQEEVIFIIKKIEKATKDDNFPRKQSALCDYCGYKNSCPSFKHESMLEKKNIEEFKKDDGVKLVDEYSEIKKQLSVLNEKEEDFKKKLMSYAKQLGVDIVYGSNMKANIKEFDKLVLPEEDEDYHNFISLLKSKGHWEECSMICYPKIQSKVIKEELHPDLIEKVKLEKDKRINLSKRKDVEED